MNKDINEINLEPSQASESNEINEANLSPEQLKQFKQAKAQAREAYRVIKRRLKPLSKSQLIGIIVDYSDKHREIQNICKQLMKELKQLKGESKPQQASEEKEVANA